MAELTDLTPDRRGRSSCYRPRKRRAATGRQGGVLRNEPPEALRLRGRRGGGRRRAA